MRNTLKLLYDRFYTPVPMAEAEQEIEVCHRQLIERLEKPERKLVLRIMDTQNLMAEERSMDSFLCGFHLALGQFTRNYTQTVKRAADNKRRYAPGEGSIPPVLLSGVSKGVPPLAHDFACKV